MAQNVYIIFILSSVLIPNEVLCTVNVCSIDYLSIVDCGFKKMFTFFHSIFNCSTLSEHRSLYFHQTVGVELQEEREVLSGDCHISGE